MTWLARRQKGAPAKGPKLGSMGFMLIKRQTAGASTEKCMPGTTRGYPSCPFLGSAIAGRTALMNINRSTVSPLPLPIKWPHQIAAGGGTQRHPQAANSGSNGRLNSSPSRKHGCHQPKVVPTIKTPFFVIISRHETSMQPIHENQYYLVIRPTAGAKGQC
jgi:hypothetical protein